MSSLIQALRNPSITNEPPTAREQRRNDLVMIAVILFALFLGWGVRRNNLNATQSLTLGAGLPTLQAPAGWIEADPEGLLLRAIDPDSPSTYDARIEVFARALREGETLDLLSVSWPLERTQSLERFRSLRSQVVPVEGEGPGLLITYAHVADPTRESGALGLPVVVKGQDLLFIHRTGDDERLVVVTVAADVTEWDEQKANFRAVFDSLGVQGE